MDEATINIAVEKIKDRMERADKDYEEAVGNFEFEDYYSGYSDALSDIIGILNELKEN